MAAFGGYIILKTSVLDILRVANQSPTPNLKTIYFLGPFDDIWGQGHLFRPIPRVPGVRAGMKYRAWGTDWVPEGSLAGILWVGFWGLGGPW